MNEMPSIIQTILECVNLVERVLIPLLQLLPSSPFSFPSFLIPPSSLLTPSPPLPPFTFKFTLNTSKLMVRRTHRQNNAYKL